MVTAFIIAIVIIVGGLVVAWSIAAGKKEELQSAIRAEAGFEDAEVLASAATAIACDDKAGRFAVAYRESDQVKLRLIPVASFESVEVEMVGQAALSKASGFGKVATQTGANQVNLCVRFRDPVIPVLRVILYIKVGEQMFGEDAAVSLGRTWESKLLSTVHAHGAAQPAPAQAQAAPAIAAPNLADEVRQLHQLLVDGILTQDEFQQAKLAALKRQAPQPMPG